jgi:hypothetical protein
VNQGQTRDLTWRRGGPRVRAGHPGSAEGGCGCLDEGGAGRRAAAGVPLAGPARRALVVRAALANTARPACRDPSARARPDHGRPPRKRPARIGRPALPSPPEPGPSRGDAGRTCCPIASSWCAQEDATCRPARDFGEPRTLRQTPVAPLRAPARPRALREPGGNAAPAGRLSIPKETRGWERSKGSRIS